MIKKIKELFINKIDLINIILSIAVTIFYAIFNRSILVFILYFLSVLYLFILVLLKKYKKLSVHLSTIVPYLLIVAIMNNCLYTFLESNSLQFWICIIISLILTFIICRICMKNVSVGKCIIVLIICIFIVDGDIMYANIVLDNQKETIIETEIKEKTESAQRMGTDYCLYFDIKDYNGKNYIDCGNSVSKKLYEKIEVGDKINIVIRKGFFDMAYYYIEW